LDKISKEIKMKKISTAIAAAAVITLASTTGVIAQNATPNLKVVTPSEGQTIYGNRIPILVAVENLQIVDFAQNTAPRSGQGHVHLWLDDPNPTRESAVKLTKDNFTYTDVAYGEHTLRTEIVNNNHTSLTPPVVTTVKFKSAPVATPSPVQVSGFDKNTALVILVVVALVILAAWWYTKEEGEAPKTAAPSPKKTTKKKAPGRRRK
jgi:hypothetical protein